MLTASRTGLSLDQVHVSKALGNKSAGFAKPKAAAGGGGAAKMMFGGGKKKSVTEALEAIRTRDPEFTCADFSGQATFQMKSEEKMKELVEALKGDGSPSPVVALVLKDCGIGNEGAATLGAFLATNATITNIDLSDNKAIKDEGGKALAEGIATDTALTDINLMGLGGGIAVRSEVICAAFIEAFKTNLTLKKPIWRLDHPLAHTLARLVTRNNSIARCISQGKPFESLLPDDLKGTGVVVAGAPAAGPAGGSGGTAE